MANRGQKRTEMVDELPADKRACSSVEFRPSTSNSSIQTHMDSVPDSRAAEADMDTSSSSSASSHSEDEEDHERDSAYGSCDSNDADHRPNRSLRDYQRQRSHDDHSRLKGALSGLSEGNDPSAVIAALTELCEILSFGTEDSVSSMIADTLSPVLVRLASTDSNPDIILLAIRALTYLCDVFPRAYAFLIRHDAVAALCQRLMAIEYLDVAEQCLQALEKISREHPQECLQGGAIMAVLSFIDFFATSVQRVALMTVVNICKKLPTECPPSVMEAVPILCNLLQYEDRQLVEHVATCLIKIVERVSQSSEMLDELCNHGLVNQAAHLIRLSSRTTLSQPIYNGLIGLLVKLCAGSVVAFRTLYDLHISSILKEILASYDLSHGMSFPHAVDGQGNQVHEVLMLLNELLPNIASDQDAQQQLSVKELFFVDHPNLLQEFGSDILPMLIQVVDSGANIYVCYGCLLVINKLVYFSKSEMRVELLKSANISSFLAGVFTRKDHHVLLLALQITEKVLQNHSDVFLNSFVKEGVFFAIEALVAPEKCSELMLPVSNGTHLPSDTSQKSVSKGALRCLCYAFDTGQSNRTSETGKCMIGKDIVPNLAKHVRSSYFSQEVCNSNSGLTDILQKLRGLSAALRDLINISGNSAGSDEDDEKFSRLLHQIMENLNGREAVSTFEFIESGIVKSLVNYISNGLYLREREEIDAVYENFHIIEKRAGVLARLFLYSFDHGEELPISVLVQKLQSAISSLESFPVVLNHVSKQSQRYATVPYGRSTSHPCFRVRFLREEGEACLINYSEDLSTVDPFSSMDEIEGFLLPRVRVKEDDKVLADTQVTDSMETVPCELPSHAINSQGESSGRMESESMSTDLPEVQENDANLTVSEQLVNLSQIMVGEASSSNGVQMVYEALTLLEKLPFQVSEEQLVQQAASTDAANIKICCHPPFSSGNFPQKLAFFLEGQQLDRNLTLYQAILQRKIRADHEINVGSKLWSHVYTLTYRTAADDSSQEYHTSVQNSSMVNKFGTDMQHTSFCSSLFNGKLASDLDKLSPTYDLLFLLKIIERLNRYAFHLISQERMHAFAKGDMDNLDNLKVLLSSVSQNVFVSSKLTEKLEQQMRDSLAVSVGGMPLWCNELMASCPFLFSFDAKCKYFRLSAFGPQRAQPMSHNSSVVSRDRRPIGGSTYRKKFEVCRARVLESASRMMELYAHVKVPIEVVYNEEVGTGLGPTLEFYTLVSHEFQNFGLGMWREDHGSFFSGKSLCSKLYNGLMSPFGLFPRPWPSTLDSSGGIQFPDVSKKFLLLGQVVAKALQDGRVLDLPFSRAFYKLILQQELNVYDIHSFDPELGRTLLEFQAIVNRNKNLGFDHSERNTSFSFDECFHNTRIEDLCLDFSLPGYPDYILISNPDHRLVNMDSLEEYVSMVVDATIHTGIARQLEAFRSGFNQVFPIKHLQIFTEEELERLLCGERDFWAFNELLDHIKFDHGYTASSPPVSNLLEIITEFNHEQRRAFLQFVTGAPRLPPGGLASLNPKLTIVRKLCSSCADADLPSVMTCANYLKLPPYSSKDKMREKLLYAITEGQGSFHLS